MNDLDFRFSLFQSTIGIERIQNMHIVIGKVGSFSCHVERSFVDCILDVERWVVKVANESFEWVERL